MSLMSSFFGGRVEGSKLGRLAVQPAPPSAHRRLSHARLHCSLPVHADVASGRCGVNIRHIQNCTRCFWGEASYAVASARARWKA